MLNGVSHSRHVLFITEASHMDIHSATSLVCLGVVNQEGFELVREADDPVGPVI